MSEGMVASTQEAYEELVNSDATSGKIIKTMDDWDALCSRISDLYDTDPLKVLSAEALSEFTSSLTFARDGGLKGARVDMLEDALSFGQFRAFWHRFGIDISLFAAFYGHRCRASTGACEHRYHRSAADRPGDRRRPADACGRSGLERDGMKSNRLRV